MTNIGKIAPIVGAYDAANKLLKPKHKVMSSPAVNITLSQSAINIINEQNRHTRPRYVGLGSPFRKILNAFLELLIKLLR